MNSRNTDWNRLLERNSKNRSTKRIENKDHSEDSMLFAKAFFIYSPLCIFTILGTLCALHFAITKDMGSLMGAAIFVPGSCIGWSLFYIIFVRGK